MKIKVRATRAYTSQMIVLGRFMAAFSRTNELLSAQVRLSVERTGLEVHENAAVTPP